MADADPSIAAQQKLGQDDADPSVAAQQKLNGDGLDFLKPSATLKGTAPSVFGTLNKALGGDK